MTRVSIIICTRDRAEHLRPTLDSLAAVSVPADLPAELIVVDNRSSDGTAGLVQGFRPANLAVRYLREPRRGKSHGLNRAMAAAQGDIFLFSDDDLRFPAGWVEGMCRPIASGRADAVVGGIRMAPHLERPWMETAHHLLVASNTWWEPATRPALVGANMAFSRRVLARVPGFDPEIGAGALGAYEDYLFSRQLERAGFRLVTALDVSVEHHFQADRLSPARMARAAEAMGRSWAYVSHHWEHAPARAPWARWARAALRLRFYQFRHRLRRRFRADDFLPGWEVTLRQDAARARQTLRERRRPRRYDRHGLTLRPDAARGAWDAD